MIKSPDYVSLTLNWNQASSLKALIGDYLDSVRDEYHDEDQFEDEHLDEIEVSNALSRAMHVAWEAMPAAGADEEGE